MIASAESFQPLPAWLQELLDSPADRLDAFLRGRVFLDNANVRDPAFVLIEWVPHLDHEKRSALEIEIKSWIARNWGVIQREVAEDQAAEAWQRVFTIIGNSSCFAESASALREFLPESEGYLAQFSVGPTLDPYESYLLALALHQHDNVLLPLWWQLCTIPDTTPYYYGAIGLAGLINVPNPSGTFPPHIAEGLVRYLVALGSLVERQVLNQRDAERVALSQARLLLATFPLRNRWRGALVTAILNQGSPLPPLVQTWVRRAFDFMHTEHSPRQAERASDEKVDELAGKLEEDPASTELLSRAQHLLSDLKQAALATGRSESFTYSLRRFSEAVVNFDPNLAFEWASTALAWNPHSPYAWTALTKAEREIATPLQALNTAFEAWERFPQNRVVSSILASTLVRLDFRAEARTVYELTADIFPASSPQVHINLSEHYRLAGEIDRSIKTLERAITFFPEVAILRRFLGAALKWSGPSNWEHAKEVLNTAREMGDLRAEAELITLHDLQGKYQSDQNSWESISEAAITKPAKQGQQRLIDALLSGVAEEKLAGITTLLRWIRLLRKRARIPVSSGADRLTVLTECATTSATLVEETEQPLWRAELLLVLLDLGDLEAAANLRAGRIATGAPLIYATARFDRAKDAGRQTPYSADANVRAVEAWRQLAEVNQSLLGVTLLGQVRAINGLQDGAVKLEAANHGLKRLVAWTRRSPSSLNEFDRWWSKEVLSTLALPDDEDEAVSGAHLAELEARADRLNILEEFAVNRRS